MKEKIILAPGASGTETLRSLAKNGVNTLGLRIVSAVELAKIALMRSGISVTEGFLTGKEEASLIYSYLNDIPYFVNASYADAQSLSAALTTVRGLAKDDEEAVKAALSKGTFTEKNEAIFDAYIKYKAALKAEGKLDGISLIKLAIKGSKPFDADFVILKEYPLTPIEKELLVHVSGGVFTESSLTRLYSKEEKAPKDLRYTEGYGSINEVEDIIACIFKSGSSLDKVTVACASSAEYAQIFYDISRRYDLPITYGSGIPITNTDPAKLLSLILDWHTSGYNGIDSLKKILLCEGFDRKKLSETLGLADTLNREDIDSLSDMAGRLRISFDKETNEARIGALKPSLECKLGAAKKTERKKDIKSAESSIESLRRTELLAKEFGLGCAGFISKYSVIRPEPIGRADQAALNVITESLSAYERYVPDGDLEDIITEILNKTVCSESSKEGHLHVTSIPGALSSIREDLYVCGLSASSFPGTPTENYLLLDDDLLAFSEDAPTSKNRIAKRKEQLDDLLSLASALACRISLSYSGYDLAELKDQNPSSVLFAIYEKEHSGLGMKDFLASIRKAEYFQSEISAARLIGREYAQGSEIEFSEEAAEKTDISRVLDKAWSPSALEVFFRCPRHFYLANILGIPEEEPDDPFAVISAAEIGTLAHSMMEALANSEMSESEFLEKSGKAFDAFLLGRPPLHEAVAEKEKRDFLDMMKTSFRLDPHNEVLSAENEYRFEHPSGIKLHGYPDRVEKDADGNFIIADFKTKRKVEHIDNDIDTCLQVVIYAWLCEQAGIDISRCEYRYLRKNKLVSCDYTEDIKAELTEKLMQFKTAIETGTFERMPSDDACKYCRMNDICLFKEDLKETEDADA